ncbi:Enolase [Candidatus Calditenuaceae archaeon HR02]|nr:Enolase [Candidatus Calditenuaceae archaeon HR02]
MGRITSLAGRVVFDSRGDKTIEVEAAVDGVRGRAAAPAGKSRGKREVEPYPPGGPEAAVKILREKVAPRIVGREYYGFIEFDQLLQEIDGTPNFSNIGGNTALATSIAALTAYAALRGESLYKLIARETGQEPALPLPLGNVLGGGKHAGQGAPEIQEYLVIPLDPKTIHEALEANIRTHRKLGEILSRRVSGFPLGKGDEGGYAPPISVEAALDAVREAAQRVGDEMGIRMGVGLDVAAGSIYDESSRRYVLKSQGLYLDREGFLNYIAELAEKASLVYIEDPFLEDDPDAFAELRKLLPNTLICGDDLVVTRRGLIEDYLKKRAINAAIIKPNQVGSLSLTWSAVEACLKGGAVPVASHRSGETNDTYLSHIAVGMGCKVIKAGVLGGERIAKANELVRISEEVGSSKLRRIV